MEVRLGEGKESLENEVAVVYCQPVLSCEQVEFFTSGVGAVILIGFATGTTPDRLKPIIQKRMNEGIPVIILTNNPGDPAGPVRLRYLAGEGNLKAGAILLQKVNINHLEEVIGVMRNALLNGIRGAELSRLMEDLYSYKEGEVPPPAEWETEEGIAGMRQSIKLTLMRVGIKGDDLKEQLRIWEFGRANNQSGT